MSTLVRLFTLLTIAAAGFALPMSCALSSAATAPIAIDIPAPSFFDVQIEADDSRTLEPSPTSLVQHLFDTLPLDCDENATPRVTENSAVFDTQPSVPGYLVSTLLLEDQVAEPSAPPPALAPLDSRAGPPDGPPPKSID